MPVVSVMNPFHVEIKEALYLLDNTPPVINEVPTSIDLIAGQEKVWNLP